MVGEERIREREGRGCGMDAMIVKHKKLAETGGSKEWGRIKGDIRGMKRGFMQVW